MGRPDNQKEAMENETQRDEAEATIKEQDLLWHYTSVDSFLSLMEKDACLYATHTDFCNDPQEVKYGYNVINEYIGKNQKEVNDLIDNEDIEMIKKETISQNYDVFVSCFSRRSDDCVDLNQWRAYTDKQQGGVAIAFSKNDFERILTGNRKNGEVKFTEFSIAVNEKARRYRLATDNHGGLRFIGQCLYNKEEQEKFFFEALKCKHQNNIEFYPRLIVALCITLFKRHAYVIEDEERIIFVQRRELRDNAFFFKGKPCIKTKITNLRELVQKVVVSPLGNPIRNKQIADFVSDQSEQHFPVNL